MNCAHRSRSLLLGLSAVLAVLALAVPLAAQSGAGGAGTLLFIGTYTSPASKGIYASRLDPSTGALSAPVLAAEARNPSFLAASGDGRGGADFSAAAQYLAEMAGVRLSEHS